MSTVRFTKQQFESALPTDADDNPLWSELGLVAGEYQYELRVRGKESSTNKRVVVRSTVRADGYAADTGEDSIRIWVESWYKSRYETQPSWHPERKGPDAWTTRTPGWEARLVAKIRETYQWAFDECKRRNAVYAPDYDCTVPNSIPTKAQSAPSIKVEKDRPDIQLTKEQQDIIAAIIAGNNHVVGQAYAGSAKTFVMVRSFSQLGQPDMPAGVFAFNTKNANDLQARMPEPIDSSTIHSKCYADIRKVYPRCRTADYKFTVHWKQYMSGLDDSEQKASYNDFRPVRFIVGKYQQMMLTPSYENAMFIIDRFGLTIDEKRTSEIEEAAEAVYHTMWHDTSKVDFNEMVFWVASGKVPASKYKRIGIDEAQDLNKSRTEALMNSVDENSIVTIIGDEYQTLYAFAGANVGNITELSKRLGATSYPLSTCFRCANSIIAEAQVIVPDIRARDNAPDGIVDHIDYSDFTDSLQQGDMVLCRVTRHLVKPCYELLRRGIKAGIRGRNISEGLKSLVKQVAYKAHADNMRDLYTALREYYYSEIAKLENAESSTRAQILEDQIGTIFAVGDGCQTIKELLERIDSLFKPNNAELPVTFSTVHQAKGDQARHVYILAPELMPHPRAEKQWQKDGERNIKYVAITRAEEHLTWVDGGPSNGLTGLDF